MKTFDKQQLLNQLQADVRQLILRAEQLEARTPAQLQQPPAGGGWSVVEVLAHLNYYARYYLNAMEERLENYNGSDASSFRAGWIGNYFTRLIGPSSGGEPVRQKLKAPADAQPLAATDLDPRAEVAEFLQHQHQLLNLLQIARAVDLGRIRIPITLTRLIRLKLGDTFRFLVAHEQRHFQQIDRVLAQLPGASATTYAR